MLSIAQQRYNRFLFYTTIRCYKILESGARIGEALSIRIQDLRTEDKVPSVTIIGKGKKMRTLYLGKSLANLLKKYVIKVHGEYAEGNCYLFFSNSKGPLTPKTRRATQKRISEIGIKAKQLCDSVPDSLHPHLFRHIYGTKRIEQNIPLPIVQKEMGHSSPVTTMKYIDITIKMKTEALKKIASEASRDVKPTWKNDSGIKALFKSLNQIRKEAKTKAVTNYTNLF